MAIQVAGATATNVQEVDPTQKASRVTLRPQEVASWASLSAQSGALTGLAAGAPIFAFRNISSNNILLRRIGAGVVVTTVFTTSQVVDIGLMIARSWTASDSGGTALTVSGSNSGKHRTSLANPTSLDVRIGTTAALTAGTRTLDPNYIGQVMGFSAALGNAVGTSPSNLFQRDDGSDYPILLAQNEGFVITAPTAWGAGGVGKLYVNMEFAEVTTASF